MANRSVLVVEDDTDTRQLLTEILSVEGYEVLDAADGRQALAVLQRRRRPDVILLDLVLPNVDGWQLLERLRANAVTASIPVVVTTAILAGLPAGVAAILRKPFMLPDLLECLDRACALAQAS